MTAETVIEDPTPLNPEYSPETIQHRETLLQTLADLTQQTGQSLLLTGPSGTGRTTAIQTVLRRSGRTTCYIPCTQYDTEYKALRHIYAELTEEDVGTGHHVSELQRQIQKQIQYQNPVIVLDDVEHLLFNDDDSLLYYLSRTENNAHLTLILTSQKTRKELELEERTRSSLQLHQETVEPYTAEETYQILASRARDSLKTRSLRREALTYIAATTQNITAGLSWLRASAENTGDVVTEDLVRTQRQNAYQLYAEHLLKDFTPHHRTLIQAIQKRLSEEEVSTVRSGDVFDEYQRLCESSRLDELSERRISDYLKQLELLQLIQSEYYYGGSKGKTREITINPF
jgi:Cdc6-like AAA superfamily ATPase